MCVVVPVLFFDSTLGSLIVLGGFDNIMEDVGDDSNDMFFC